MVLLDSDLKVAIINLFMKLKKNLQETDEELAIFTKEQESIKKKTKWNFQKWKDTIENCTDRFNSSLYTTEDEGIQINKNILFLYEE